MDVRGAHGGGDGGEVDGPIRFVGQSARMHTCATLKENKCQEQVGYREARAD